MTAYAIEFNEEQNFVEIIYEGVNAALLAEMNVRLTNLENAFAAHVASSGGSIGYIESDIDSLTTLILATQAGLNTEIATRELADLNINESFSTELIAINDTFATAIADEAEARAQGLLDEATARGAAIEDASAIIMTDVAILATSVEGMATELGAAQASIITVQDALVTETAARAAQYSAIQADYGDTNAAVLEESVARADADSAMASDITALSVSIATKINSYYQTSAPTATAVGDIWYDTDDGNKMYRWSGSTWQTVDNAQIATNTANIITVDAARVTGDTANASSITALGVVVATKNITFSQTTAPSSGMVSGDLWFDTDDGNKAYRYNGSSWIATDDTRIAANSAAVISEQSARIAADGSIEAKYTVKIDVNGNISGYGLIATANNGTVTSAFNVTASSFNVWNGSSANPVFSVSGGVVSMTNVKIGTAVIDNLAVTSGKIANFAVNKVVANSGGSSSGTTLTSATWTQVCSCPLSGSDWNDGTNQYQRIVTVSVDMRAVDTGTFANAFCSARIITGNGSYHTLWEGLSDSGVTTLKNYGQIKGSFTIVHDVDDGFVSLSGTRYYILELYATGATSRQYFKCTMTVQSVKK